MCYCCLLSIYLLFVCMCVCYQSINFDNDLKNIYFKNRRMQRPKKNCFHFFSNKKRGGRARRERREWMLHLSELNFDFTFHTSLARSLSFRFIFYFYPQNSRITKNRANAIGVTLDQIICWRYFFCFFFKQI